MLGTISHPLRAIHDLKFYSMPMDTALLHSFRTIMIPVKCSTRSSNFSPSHESVFMATLAVIVKPIIPSIMEAVMCWNHVHRTPAAC